MTALNPAHVAMDARAQTPATGQCAPACPFCQSPRTATRDGLDRDTLLREWKQTLGIDIASQLPHATVGRHRCDACGLGFFTPQAAAGTGWLYEQLAANPWYYPALKWEHLRALRWLEPFDRVLEVGCGCGAFLDLAQQRRHVRAEGLEINRTAARQACDRGFPVEVGSVSELAQQQPGGYDVVCSFQVLEHVTDPAQFLRAQVQLLKPGGRLVVGVPNAQSYLKHQHNVLDMPPHHMTRWTARTLAHATRLLPLKLHRVLREPLAECHVPAYVGTYARRIADRTHWRLRHPRFLEGLSQALRLTGLRRLLLGQTLLAVYTRTRGEV